MMLTGQRNQCRGCNQYFNSNLAFDKHRTGHFGHNRRCLTPDEMIAKGMSLNKRGFWVTEAMSNNVMAKRKANDDRKEN